MTPNDTPDALDRLKSIDRSLRGIALAAGAFFTFGAAWGTHYIAIKQWGFGETAAGWIAGLAWVAAGTLFNMSMRD